MRSIKQIHSAISAPMGDLITYRAMPTSSVEHIDPFLFLNHHGPQKYGPNNKGLPFGPHPHRGFETLTFIIDGDIVHWDSSGSKSKIDAGGIQWMTAGSGLIHSEVSSEEFKEKGGDLEILQLWMNLPSDLKMTAPKYKGLTYDEIKHIKTGDGKGKVNLISGQWNGQEGPIDSPTNLMMSSVELKEGGVFEAEVPEENNIFFYVVRGEVEINDQRAAKLQLVEFDNDDRLVKATAKGDSLLLFGHGKPFNEPIVAHGPFVMNSHEEIQLAFQDYQSGKMGSWQ